MLCAACGFCLMCSTIKIKEKNKDLRINLADLLSQLGAQTAFPVVFSFHVCVEQGLSLGILRSRPVFFVVRSSSICFSAALKKQ